MRRAPEAQAAREHRESCADSPERPRTRDRFAKADQSDHHAEPEDQRRKDEGVAPRPRDTESHRGEQIAQERVGQRNSREFRMAGRKVVSVGETRRDRHVERHVAVVVPIADGEALGGFDQRPVGKSRDQDQGQKREPDLAP